MNAIRGFSTVLGLAAALSCGSLRAEPVPLYETYNQQYQDFFYTIDPSQRDIAVSQYGYVYRGIAARVESTQIANTLPFWRFYKGLPQTDHFYTTDAGELNYVLSYGWQYERVEGYLFAGQAPGTVPMYRYHYWEGATSELMHYYTVDSTLRPMLESYGWVQDGLAGYVYPPTPTAPPPSSAPTAQICIDSRYGTGVVAVSDGSADVVDKIRTCLEFGVLSNGVWEIPKGIYSIGGPIDSLRSLTWRTAGTQSAVGCYYGDTTAAECAILRAHPNIDANLTGRHPMIQITLPGFAMDHLIIDGNRSSRPQTCADNYRGSNVYFTSNAANSRFTNSVSMNALCGSGLVIDANGMMILGNYLYQNGINPADPADRLWADGLTLTNCSNCIVDGNRLIDNTDVQMVMGNGEYTQITNNLLQSSTRRAFAAFALDNFDNSEKGNFGGTIVQGNLIRCEGFLCNIGMNIGPHAWYSNGGNIKGGAVLYNSVSGANVGVLIDGAGTPSNPTSVFGNNVTGSPTCGTTIQLTCGGVPAVRHTCNWVYNDRNYGHQGDSYVELNGENGALYPGNYGESWHGCH